MNEKHPPIPRFRVKQKVVYFDDYSKNLKLDWISDITIKADTEGWNVIYTLYHARHDRKEGEINGIESVNEVANIARSHHEKCINEWVMDALNPEEEP